DRSWFSTDHRARGDQWHEELRHGDLLTVEVVDVHLGRVHTRPGACDAAAVSVTLLPADDLDAVQEDRPFRSSDCSEQPRMARGSLILRFGRHADLRDWGSGENCGQLLPRLCPSQLGKTLH